MSEFKVGDKVRHKRYGVGEVLGVEPGVKFNRLTVSMEDGNSTIWHDTNCTLLQRRHDERPFDLFGAMTGKPLVFRSGCDVRFIAYAPDAKPHCQLVLLNPATGNIVTRYANGKASEEPYSEPGDILIKEQA